MGAADEVTGHSGRFFTENMYTDRRMNSRILSLLILISGLFFSRVPIADDQQCPPITVTESPYLHETWYGYENPEMIPEFIKYRALVTRYNEHLTELVQQLTLNDHSILMDVKSEREYWREIEGERYSNDFANLCEENSSMDAVAIATKYEEIALAHNNRMSDRINAAVTALSPTGRQAVLDYIDYVITPKLQYPKTNSVTLAVDDPDTFLGIFHRRCHIKIHGEPSPEPPEIKRVRDCYRQQIDGDRTATDQSEVVFFPRAEKTN